MFNTLTAMRSAGGDSYAFGGKFDFPATSSANLITYLDAAVIAEDSSHLWNPTVTTEADEGTLVNSGGFNTFTMLATGAVVPVADADFRQGLVDVLDQPLGTRMHLGSSSKIPSAMDGTKSFLFGGLAKIFTIHPTDSQTAFVMMFRISGGSGGNGWNIFVRDAAHATLGLHLGFQTLQNGYAGTYHTVNAAQPIVLGEAFAFVANLDVAAGKLKIMTSAPGSYAEIPWTDLGAFDSTTQELRVGDADWTAHGDNYPTMRWAQMFSLEYSPVIDAGINEDTMINFLKFNDGTLSV
jgi:hypothetical protein